MQSLKTLTYILWLNDHVFQKNIKTFYEQWQWPIRNHNCPQEIQDISSWIQKYLYPHCFNCVLCFLILFEIPLDMCYKLTAFLLCNQILCSLGGIEHYSFIYTHLYVMNLVKWGHMIWALTRYQGKVWVWVSYLKWGCLGQQESAVSQ